MELLSAIRRNLLLRPLRGTVIDDQRTWRGIDLMVVAWHLAREIERKSTAQRIGVMLPTSGAFPAAAIAAWTLGRTIVPLNYLLSRSDLEYVARDAGLDAVITVGPMVDFIGGPVPGLVEIRPDQMRFTGIPPVRMTNPLQRDDLAVVLYTSGTSGPPKGVPLTHRNVGTNGVDWLAIYGAAVPANCSGQILFSLLAFAVRLDRHGARAEHRRADGDGRRRDHLKPVDHLAGDLVGRLSQNVHLLGGRLDARRHQVLCADHDG
jgi:acyl-CoA synthetase (AMP-forming)/AMP-acid ligase II